MGAEKPEGKQGGRGRGERSLRQGGKGGKYMGNQGGGTVSWEGEGFSETASLNMLINFCRFS
jgi:hypothetical protein